MSTKTKNLLPACSEMSDISSTEVTEVKQDTLAITHEIPLQGNAFITNFEGPGEPTEWFDNTGINDWSSAGTTWSVYFRVSKPEVLTVSLRLQIPYLTQTSFVYSWGNEAIANVVEIPDAHGGAGQNVLLGTRLVTQPGYMKLSFKGLTTTGTIYAHPRLLLVTHNDPDNEVIFNVNEEAYFGRRGPSVHLRYLDPTLDDKNVEYYYNELTVPPGNDIQGLYAMAVGFTGGYFGIQVNGPEERRVLFSVWSEYKTDDPGQVPEDYKVRLIEKGEGVYDGEFGDEGVGAQSYLKFSWSAGSTYRFLINGRPIDADNTRYTAWFKTPGATTWQLIASFRKPKVSVYLSNFYSFLENFDPEEGFLERRAHYGNQWARDTTGKWHELIEAKFTGDATSKMGRRDFAGGLRQDGSNLFFLRHCGFFDDTVPTDQNFKRVAEGKVPEI